MGALIDGQFNCFDAAVETINAHTGLKVCKGTLSKRQSSTGNVGWPVDEIMALEDASGVYPVTKMMARRLNPDEDTAAGSLLVKAGKISKESGEAVAAILAAQQSECSNDRAQAIVEIGEAISAMEKARAIIEAIDE
jgi:hypothetical protein